MCVRAREKNVLDVAETSTFIRENKKRTDETMFY